MFDHALTIEAELVVLSPFHPGSGEAEDAADLMRKEDRERLPTGQLGPSLQQIQRDDDGRPYIVGTTLKGILRRLTPMDSGAAYPELAVDESLFGTIKTQAGGGQIGCLTVYGSPMTAPGPTQSLPKGQPKGIYVGARTAIDADTGTAAGSRLFYQELIAPGARFRLRLRLSGPRSALGSAERTRLAQLLRSLSEPEGVAVGRGQADGQGRLRLDTNTLRAIGERIDSGGLLRPADIDLKSDVSAAQPIAATDTRYRLILEGEGPFLVNDWWHALSRERKRERGEEDEGTPQLRAQRRDEHTPELPGTSVMGALRARAEWLANIAALRGGSSGVAAGMSPVERLFGKAEFAALLRLVRLVPRTTPRRNLTSVKLDRFSGAPIDNALFTVDAFVDPVFEVELGLDSRRADSSDEALTTLLLDDLAKNGLTIGHAGNRGFGWFKVRQE